MQNTTNAFLEGIITDFNPLTMPETAMTSALNATVITLNGNEQILQNDMGNTSIKDSITGKVMSLNDGFVPVGMKEHGGILYIASYNPNTKEGELGSIPSPIINYTYQKEEEKLQNTRISDLTGSGNLEERINTNVIYLSDTTFHAGDKFIPVLNIGSVDENRSTWDRTYVDGTTYPYPYISTIDTKGWYKIKLYAVTDNNSEIPLDDITSTKQQYVDTSGEIKTSDYWYIKSEDILNGIEDILNGIDEESTKIHNFYRTFPNVRAGKLAIKVEPELHEKLEYTKNDSYNNNYPSIFITENSETFVVINGLKYVGSCAIQPDKIEIVVNGNENPDLYIYKYKNKNGNFEPLTDPLKIGSREILKTTKSGDTYFISNKKYTDDDANIINYGEASLNYQICAIKVDNLMQSINVLVKLYVKDASDEYVYYRTDTLPSFTPAEVELGISESNTTVVNQYYQKKDDSGSFDILLFNKLSDSDQRCFIYNNATDHILKYNNTTNLYEPVQKPNSLDFYKVNDYKEIKTWIYPQYGVCVDNNGKTKKYSYKGKKVALIAPLLYLFGNDHEAFASSYATFFNKSDFVVCAYLPKVTVKENGELKKIPLLLPVSFTVLNANLPGLVMNELACQRDYFNGSPNEFGLTTALIKQNCLFATNIEAIKTGVSLPFDANNYIDHAGIYYGTVANSIGIDRFWDKNDPKSSGDTALCISPDNDQIIIIQNPDDKQGLINIPKTLSKRSGQNIINFSHYNYCDPGNDEIGADDSSYIAFYEFNLHYSNEAAKNKLGQIAAKGIRTPGKSNTPIDHEYYTGCLNTEISLCPGYFDSNFSLNLKLFNYAYSSKYLYTSPINFSLKNLGDKTISYFKLLGVRTWWLAHERSMHLGLLDDKFTLSTAQTKGTEITNWSEIKSVGDDILSSKIKLNDGSILTNDVECSILPEHNTYDFKYNISITNANNILGRLFVVAPQIFLGIRSGALTKKYLSDYQIIRLFDIGENGFYKTDDDRYILTKSNIDTSKNYLASQQSSIIDGDETLLYCGITGQSPQDSSFKKRNSFCFSKGYLSLLASGDITIFNNKEILFGRSGIYVLHINHNGKFTDTETTITFKIKIGDAPELTFTDDYIAFYIKESNTRLNINLSCRTSRYFVYIKNIGLYKLSDDESKWTQIGDNYKYSSLVSKAEQSSIYFYNSTDTKGIVFPAAFCFKEQYNNGSSIGCLDLGFSGFQSLPSHSYLRCVGNYRINSNRESVIEKTPYCNSEYAQSIVPDGTIIQSLRNL